MSIPIGYKGKVSQGGAATAIAGEATAQIGTSKTYQIVNAAKRVLDPNTAIVVKDGGVAVPAADIVLVNAMNGSVTFINSYTPAGAITFDGKYIPRAAVADVDEASSNPKLNMVEKTPINSAGYVQRAPTTLDWDGDFRVQQVLSEQGFDALLDGKTPALVEFDPASDGTAVTRGWALLTASTGGIKPKEIVSSQVKYSLYDQSSIATALSGFTVNAAFAAFTS